MKKFLYTIISILLLLFLLVFPQEALLSAREGMQLWLNVLLPTLLPFIILTGILIQTDLISSLLRPLEPFWKKVFGISSSGAYALFFGLLCGYPMGAKLTSDLYTGRKINRQEAQYLLTFTNYASPVFVRSYLIHTCMNEQVSAAEVFGLLLGSSFITMLLMRLRFFRKKTAPEFYAEKKEASHSDSSGVLLDASIMNGFETITRLGGYILIFSILTAFIRHFQKSQTLPSLLLLCLLEMTSGLHQLACTSLSLETKYLCALVTVILGGICITMQTRSLTSDDLSLLPYLAAKFLNALIVTILFFIKII